MSAHAATLSEVVKENVDGDVVIKIGGNAEKKDDDSSDKAGEEKLVIKLGDTVEDDDHDLSH